MKRLLYLVCISVCAFVAVSMSGCDDDETYADMKNKEKRAINKFLKDNDVCGPITTISEAEFLAKDTVTDTAKNEFVLFNEDGIYMQIVNRGEGKSMEELAREEADTTVSKVIICRFLEYDIENGYIVCNNHEYISVYDKMMCRYDLRGRSFTASFEKGGIMYSKYGSVVPKGWLKPLSYIRLTKQSGREAKVRLIVPHSSGTSNASGYVLPMYYEISYLLPPNW